MRAVSHVTTPTGVWPVTDRVARLGRRGLHTQKGNPRVFQSSAYVKVVQNAGVAGPGVVRVAVVVRGMSRSNGALRVDTEQTAMLQLPLVDTNPPFWSRVISMLGLPAQPASMLVKGPRVTESADMPTWSVTQVVQRVKAAGLVSVVLTYFEKVQVPTSLSSTFGGVTQATEPSHVGAVAGAGDVAMREEWVVTDGADLMAQPVVPVRTLQLLSGQHAAQSCEGVSAAEEPTSLDNCADDICYEETPEEKQAPAADEPREGADPPPAGLRIEGAEPQPPERRERWHQERHL